MDSNWIKYKCKSGQTLFIYNKVTGEHKWPTNNTVEEKCAMVGQSVVYKEVSTIGTQTDDNGCDNGCTSMYINASNNVRNIEISSNEVGDDFDIKPGVDHELGDRGMVGTMKHMNEIDAMIIALEEKCVSKIDGESREETFYINSDKDSCLNLDSAIQGTNEHEELTDENHKAVGDSVDNNNINLEIDSVVLKGKEMIESKQLVELTNENNSHEIKATLNQDNLNKPQECKHCEQTFDDKSLLLDHVKLHKGEKLFSCSYCTKKFVRNYNLTRHLRSHTGEKPFECSDCNMKFASKEHLKSHIRKHTGEKPFECSYCKKTFSQKNNLKIHLRTHTGEKPFVCNYCEKKFARRESLKCHIRIHTGEKPFECSNCEKKFALKYYLKLHQLVHTGEKLFECSYCGKKFARKENLDYHLRIHTGQMPFECFYCGKKYARKQRLQYHIKTHTVENPV